MPDVNEILDDSISFQVKYIGSARIIEPNREGLNFVKNILDNSKTYSKGTVVLFDISSSTIRIGSIDGKIVHMEYALTGISYVTYDVDSSQFAFCTHQPSMAFASKEPLRYTPPGVQYCHLFRTRQAREINVHLGNAIRMDEMRRGNHNHEQPVGWNKDEKFMTVSSNDGSLEKVYELEEKAWDLRGIKNDCRGHSLDLEKTKVIAELETRNKGATNDFLYGLEKLTNQPPSNIFKEMIPPTMDTDHSNPVVTKQADIDSRLRLESKRKLRRPVSAVLPTLAGSTNGDEIMIEPEVGSQQNRAMSLFGGSTEETRNKVDGKNASIFKRLFHLRIGSGSSLRLNLLNDGHTASERTSQSVRAKLNNPNEKSNSIDDTLITASSKRRRRPLSAVFGNANGQKTYDFEDADIKDELCQNSNLVTAIPTKSSKFGPAKAAVSKMFGFSSSRRKSRSSVQLDIESRRQKTMSVDLNITTSSNGDIFDSRLRGSCYQSQPFIQNWPFQKPPMNNALNFGGTGCGEQCSLSMPNLRNDFEHLLPLSLEETIKLNGAAWFYGKCSRQTATRLLENDMEGAFIVRYSVSHPSPSLVLSVRVPANHNPCGISHYLILHTNKGFKLKLFQGFIKDFPSVHALVTHHSIMAEQLPCPLVFTDRLKRTSPLLYNDHAYQMYQRQRASVSRHSSPFMVNKRDLVPVTEEETIYAKLPSPYPPLSDHDS